MEAVPEHSRQAVAPSGTSTAPFGGYARTASLPWRQAALTPAKADGPQLPILFAGSSRFQSMMRRAPPTGAGPSAVTRLSVMQRMAAQARFARIAGAACAAIALGSGGAARAAELVAPSGVTGAGTRPDCNGRAWAELGFSARDEDVVAWTQLGFGVRPGRSLELEALLPVAYGIIEQEALVQSGDGGRSGTPLWIGNPYFGANLLVWGDPGVRWRIGGGFTLPVTSIDEYGGSSDLERVPFVASGRQEPHLWQPGGPSFVGRARAEIDAGGVTVSFDLAAIVTVGVLDTNAYPSERTAVLFLQPAVELAGHVSPDTLVGGRLPAVWDSLEEALTVAITPFLRQELGALFAEAQLTLGVVGQYGLLSPATDASDPVWGMQLGIGARF